eukprot:1451989-Prymnesium_polylepis.1
MGARCSYGLKPAPSFLESPPHHRLQLAHIVAPRMVWQMRGDAGECLLLLRRYFHRTPEDLEGLTFKQWQAKKGELLVVNSSELRAVQAHQKNDFVLRLINPPVLREKTARGGAKKNKARPTDVEYGARQKWGLDPEIDRDTRR